jgi:hypothetical protein
MTFCGLWLQATPCRTIQLAEYHFRRVDSNMGSARFVSGKIACAILAFLHYPTGGSGLDECLDGIAREESLAPLHATLSQRRSADFSLIGKAVQSGFANRIEDSHSACVSPFRTVVFGCL